MGDVTIRFVALFIRDCKLALDEEGAEGQRESQRDWVNAGPAPPESEGVEDEDDDGGDEENASHGLVLGSGS